MNPYSNKVLIVTYYWPPSAGGGVKRWLKFSKYLPEYNWQPYIFTPDNPHFSLQDPYLAEQIMIQTTVIKRKIWEPYKLIDLLPTIQSKNANTSTNIASNVNQGIIGKSIKWVRANLLIPDPRVFWVNPSVRFLKKYLIEHKINNIVTTGPPHSMHLIGLGLKKSMPELHWIADFRDPWTEFDLYNQLPLSKHSPRPQPHAALGPCCGTLP